VLVDDGDFVMQRGVLQQACEENIRNTDEQLTPFALVEGVVPRIVVEGFILQRVR